MTREDVVGIDFKIINSNKVNKKLGLHIIQTFEAQSNSEYLNLKGMASFQVKILSKEGIERQEYNL